MNNELFFYDKEFETAVRDELEIFDKAVCMNDVQLLLDLDCSMFTFDERDLETLAKFTELKHLSINLRRNDMSFLRSLRNLEELNIEYYGSSVDFNCFSHLSSLKELFVSGGDISDMSLNNLQALAELKMLKSLTLHEFGDVDLSFLELMDNLEGFYCGYADEVKNIEAVGQLKKLQNLALIGLQVNNLDFLDSLKNDVDVALIGIDMIIPVDSEKLKRFNNIEIDELYVHGERID